MGFLNRDKGGGSGGAAGGGFGHVLAEGTDIIEQLGQIHQEHWGLGTGDTWTVDQQAGVIRWTFPDKTAEAPVQMIGTHNPGAGSWLWAWANESVLPPLRRDAELVREWGKANGQAFLTEPKMKADEDTAWTLAAMAMAITKASGFYRGPAGASLVYMTFGVVTITADGKSTTFKINVE